MKAAIVHGVLGVLTLIVFASQAQRAHAFAFCPAEQFSRSIEGTFQSSIRFVNASTEKTFRIYWLDYAGQRQLYKTLKPGKAFTQISSLTHPWVVTNTKDDCKKIIFTDGQRRTVTLQ